MCGPKKFPQEKRETAVTSRTHKDAKMTLKYLAQPRNKDEICEYDSYVYMMSIITGLL